MGIRKQIKKRALGLSAQAMEKLFADERRATKVANAIGAVQRSKKNLDKTQAVVLHQLNFATRADFKDIGRSLSSLNRRVRDLEKKLGALA